MAKDTKRAIRSRKWKKDRQYNGKRYQKGNQKKDRQYNGNQKPLIMVSILEQYLNTYISFSYQITVF
jgi:hypothetical protein